MLSPTNVSKLSASALDEPRQGTISARLTNTYSPPRRCDICYALFSHLKPSRNHGTLILPRPLPIPPAYPPPLPTSSTPPLSPLSSSTPSLTSVSHTLPRRSQFVFTLSRFYLHPIYDNCRHTPRPLPELPRSTPSQLRTTGCKTYINDQSSSPRTNHLTGTLSVPHPSQADYSAENCCNRQHHSGKSATTDVGPPKLDSDELSYIEEEEEDYGDPPLAPSISELTDTEPRGTEMLARARESCNWLWEKNGRRWVEEDYRVVAQCLRGLR